MARCCNSALLLSLLLLLISLLLLVVVMLLVLFLLTLLCPLVFLAVGIAWASAVVMVSAGSCITDAAVILTADDVPGVPALARVSEVSVVLTAVDIVQYASMIHVFPAFLGH